MREPDALPEGVIRADEIAIRNNPSEEERLIKRTPTSRVMRAYQDYFDLGEGRSYSKLAEQYQKIAEIHGPNSVPTVSAGTLAVWGSKWNWQLQIRIDGGHLANERRASRAAHVTQVAERQSQASRILQQIALKRIQKFVDVRTGELTEEGLALSPAEARKMLLEGAKLERELMGGTRNAELSYLGEDEISYE